jgi:4-hydroxy-3-polyprenylbenzoate decarboxylase
MGSKEMANKDLRDWIEGIKAAGELKIIHGAEPKEEIGGFVDIYQRKMGNPAIMFDEVPGYPQGYRVIANILTSVPRINVALGLPPKASEMELVHWWRDYMRRAPSLAPKAVNGGPLLENVMEGKDINIEKIPTPVWHEHDGGPFIGTACMVAMKDPDSGWINYGCYRIQTQAPDVATIMMSPGKHGRIIMGKYHDRGEPCPVAVIAGMHPALFMLAGLEVPYGKSEIEAAGGILGEPIEVFNMPRTGLPVPANSEIAFEGLIHPGDEIQEGPLGEWTGYYAGGSRPEPAIRISTFMHRDDPVLMGAIPAVPPNDNTFYLGTYRCGAVWNQLEAAGIPEVRGVWAHEAGGSRFMLTVSIKQLYGGHAKQAGMVASHCHAGAYCNRWTIVVDEDIDPTNFNDVIWAMCTRCDPRDQLDIIHGGWSSALDPMCYDGETDRRNSRVIINACIPFNRKKTFPIIARASKELDARMRAKWAKDLPPGF